MFDFTLVWRPVCDGDFYEQTFKGYDSLDEVMAFWTEFWGLEAEECHIFTVTESPHEA